MNQFPVEISYPNPDDSTVARLSMKVFRAGNALMLSPNGEVFEFEINSTEAHQMLDAIMVDCSRRASCGLYPYREAYQLPVVGDNTPVQIDAEIAAELAAALFCVVAQNDIGDLLDEYPVN